MTAASSRFQTVREEDLDSLLVDAVPEKTKIATKYGIKIFHGKKWSRKTILMNLFFVETFKSKFTIIFKLLKSCISVDTFFVNKF